MEAFQKYLKSKHIPHYCLFELSLFSLKCRYSCHGGQIFFNFELKRQADERLRYLDPRLSFRNT